MFTKYTEWRWKEREGGGEGEREQENPFDLESDEKCARRQSRMFGQVRKRLPWWKMKQRREMTGTNDNRNTQNIQEEQQWRNEKTTERKTNGSNKNESAREKPPKSTKVRLELIFIWNTFGPNELVALCLQDIWLVWLFVWNENKRML